MSWFARPLSTAALSLVLVAGCAGPAADEAGTSAGAATTAEAPGIAGSYSGHIRGWDGSLEITKASSESFTFAFDISPDDDNVAPIGRIDGVATRTEKGYRYVDGNCSIDFEPATDARGAQRGDLFVNASITCAILLGLDGHSTASTALDFTATWRRVGR